MSRRRPAGRLRAVRVLLALTAITACLGAVAFAATRPVGVTGKPGKQGASKKQQGTTPPRPNLIEVPGATPTGSQVQFRFNITPRAPVRAVPAPGPWKVEPAPQRREFECRLDERGWDSCRSPHVLAGLAPGDHDFAVRGLSPAGRAGQVAHYAWRQLEQVRPVDPPPTPTPPQQFSIEPQGALAELLPGEAAQELPLLISNPNSVPIEVTSLTVALSPAPAGCPGDPNFELTPSSVSPQAPLLVPAGGSVELPSATATAPTIAMRNLPVNQNACQGAELPLVFSGEAHG